MAAKMTIDDRAKALAGIEPVETERTTWNRYTPGLIPAEVVHRQALAATHMREVEAAERARCVAILDAMIGAEGIPGCCKRACEVVRGRIVKPELET